MYRLIQYYTVPLSPRFHLPHTSSRLGVEPSLPLAFHVSLAASHSKAALLRRSMSDGSFTGDARTRLLARTIYGDTSAASGQAYEAKHGQHGMFFNQKKKRGGVRVRFFPSTKPP